MGLRYRSQAQVFASLDPTAPPAQAELGSTLWVDLEGQGPLRGRVLWTPLGEGDLESYAWSLPPPLPAAASGRTL